MKAIRIEAAHEKPVFSNAWKSAREFFQSLEEAMPAGGGGGAHRLSAPSLLRIAGRIRARRGEGEAVARWRALAALLCLVAATPSFAYDLSVSNGPAAGDNSVIITNCVPDIGGGSDITNVTVGGYAAALDGQGANWVSITMPPNTEAGMKDISIQSESAGETLLSNAYTYNPAGGINDYIADAWTEVSNLVYRRNSMAAAAYEGGLFVIGGYDGTAMGEVQRYNGTAWSNVTALPAGTAELGAGVVGTSMYTVAGRNTGGSAISSVYRYTGSGWASAPSLPVACYGLGVATVGTNLYAVGGYSGGVVITNVYRFLGTGWVAVAGLPAQRAYHGVAALDDALYCVAGRTGYSSGATTNVFRYDGTNWTEVAGLPTSRCDLAVGALNGRLYAFGGGTGSTHAVTNVYRFDGTRWSEVRGLPAPRRSPAAGVYSGKLYAIGGYTTSATNKVYRYTEERHGVNPMLGPCTGGFPVVLSGTNLGNGADITNVTLCGIAVQSIQSQCATQVVVVAAAAPPGTGDARVFSAAFGETVQSNVFTYAWPSLKVLGSNGAPVASAEAPSAAKGTFFQHVVAGASRTRTFAITNDGPLPLDITGWVTSGASAAKFAVSNLPAAVSVGGVSNFTVTFTPDAAAEFAAAVEIANSSTTTPYVVNVSGWGCEASPGAGPYSGGNTITITNGSLGDGSDITNVTVDGMAAAIAAQGATWVTIVLPANTNAGLKDILIQSASAGDIQISGAYTYHPAGRINDDLLDTWTEVEGLPAPRYSSAASALNGSLYTVAGYVSGSLAATNVYRCDGEHWTEVMGILNGVSTLGSTGRYSMASATLGSWLYTVGARMAGSGAGTNRVDRFDGTNWETATNTYYPYHVYGLGAGVLGTNLYAFGGYGNLPGYGSSALTNAYRFAETGWVPVAGLPSRRLNMGAGVLNGRLYCVGGRYEYSTDPRTNVFCYDGTNWTEVAGLPTARCDLAVGAVGDYLYAVGGSTGSFHAVTNVYQFDGSRWREVKGLPAPRCRLAGAALGDGLYAVGGYGAAPATNVYRYDWESCGVNPGGGTTNGGYPVTIRGRNLGNGSDITNVTLCGVPVQSIQSQSPSQVVVIAAAREPDLGDVRLYSVSYGETVKSNAFEYQLARLVVYGTNGAVIVSGEAADAVKGAVFGYVAAGRAVTNDFCLRGGWVDLNILGVTTGGAQAASFSVIGMPSAIPTRTTAVISVVFHPDVAGAHAAALTISNDGTNSDYVVNLSGLSCGVTPLAGPFAGGNTVTITNGILGSGSDITNVVVGTVRAAGILAQGANWVTFVLPTNTAGTKDVLIQSASVGSTLFPDAYTYNPAGGILNDVPSSWTNMPGLPDGRYDLGCGVVNGALWALGGYNSSARTNVYRFNGASWTEAAGLPQARAGFGYAVLSNALYIVGGNATNVYRFNGTNWSEVAGLPQTRLNLACATWNNALYAIGGSESTNVYRFSGTNWTEVAGLPQPRQYHGCGVLGGALYVAGGYYSSVSRSNVYRFDGTNWIEVAPLPAQSSKFGYEVLGGALYIVNGYAWGAPSSWPTNVLRYAPSECSAVAGLPSNEGLACGVLDGSLYAMGGEASGWPKTNVTRFLPARYGVYPSGGSATGGYPVTITGSNLCDGADVTNVTLCGIAAASIQSQSPTQIVVLAGAGGVGWGDVAVCSVSYGTTIKSNAFAYLVPGLQVRGTNGAVIASGEAAAEAKGAAFGSVHMNSTVTNRFSVTNHGAAAVAISGWTTNGAGAAAFQVSGLPASLSAGATATFSVAFGPQAVGVYAASLDVVNDSTATPYVVNFSGSAYLLSPPAGPAAGGNMLMLTNGVVLGDGSDITNVTVCGVAASITAQGATWVQIVLGAGPTNGATGSVVVQSASAGSTVFADAYTYNPIGRIVGSFSTTATIGSGALTNGTTSDGPVNIYYRSRHFQFVYTSNDLATAGIAGPGRITSLGFKIAQTPAYAMPSFLVRMKHTTSNNMAGGFQSAGLTVCHSNASYTPAAGGFDMITLTTPFDWNGTDNILLDTAFAQTQPSYHSSGQSAYDAISSRARMAASDGSDQSYVFTGGSTLSHLPQLRLVVTTTGEAVSPTNGSTVGGYPVTIRGVHLCDGSDVTNVTLCGVSAAGIVSQSATQLVVMAGAGAPGLGDVRVYSASFGEAVGSNVFAYVRTHALLTVASEYGSASPPAGVHTNALNAVVTNFVASPDTRGTTQYICSGWAMAGHDPGSGSGAEVVMTVTNDATLVWLWTTNCWLDTEAGAHGSVNVGDGWQAFGVSTQITAIADAHYHFTNWTGAASGGDNPLNLWMDGPKSVTAGFAENLATNDTPEWWLDENYPGTNDFDSAALSDTDGDGMAAWGEFIAGTEPTNHASRLVLTEEAVAGDGGYVISWASVADRHYSVYCCTNLQDSAAPVAIDLAATPPANVYTDRVHCAEATVFYRIRVRQ